MSDTPAPLTAEQLRGLRNRERDIPYAYRFYVLQLLDEHAGLTARVADMEGRAAPLLDGEYHHPDPDIDRINTALKAGHAALVFECNFSAAVALDRLARRLAEQNTRVADQAREIEVLREYYSTGSKPVSSLIGTMAQVEAQHAHAKAADAVKAFDAARAAEREGVDTQPKEGGDRG